MTDQTVSPEDGLTETEREFLTTPISQMSPDSVRMGLAIREKKAEFIANENAKHRSPPRVGFNGEHA